MEKHNSSHCISTTTKKKGVTQSSKVFSFYEMKNGSKISCHGKPKKSDIIRLKKEFGVNMILTILYDKEKPELIKQFTESVGDIKWKNLPLCGANMALFMKPQTQKMIIECISDILKYMKDNKTILFLHCAAGVHRTGTILYTILRATGETKETAMEAIKAIRMETYRNCGSNRINYAEEFLVKPLLEVLNNNNK